MELTTKGRYAVMAMVDLAGQSDRIGGTLSADDCKSAGLDVAAAVPLSAVAERQKISLAYLEQIFLKLRRAELVESARGRAGGYRLGRPADKIVLRDIMLAVEEETSMTRCGQQADTPCMAGQRCETHDLWSALGAHIDDFLSTVTLADVVAGRLAPLPKRASQEAGVLRATGVGASAGGYDILRGGKR